MNNDQKDCFVSIEDAIEPEAQVDIKGALILKRQNLLRALKQIDVVISQVQEEHSTRLEQLQAQRKPSEEALHHVEALLRLEGYPTINGRNARNSTNGAAATGTAFAIDATFSLLEELQQPMHYKHIVGKLQERQIYIPGNDPAATLLSRMSRDSRFKRTKRGTYALSTWRVRAAKSRHTKGGKAGKR